MLVSSGCASLVSIPDKEFTLNFAQEGRCTEVKFNVGREIRFIPPSKKIKYEACLCAANECAAMTTEELNRLIRHLQAIMSELPRIGFLDSGVEINIKETLRGVRDAF